MTYDNCILALYNIPEDFDSFSLREFFENFIEKKAFICFHFKNRPESNLRKCIEKLFPSVNVKENLQTPSDSIESDNNVFDFQSFIKKDKTQVEKIKIIKDLNTKGCFIEIKAEFYEEFVNLYNNRLWEELQDDDGQTEESISCTRCCITFITHKRTPELSRLEEFCPPDGLHEGNVGSSNLVYARLVQSGILSDHFLDKIAVRLPAVWRWAHMGCPHDCPPTASSSSIASTHCVTVLVFNIPSHFTASDLHCFFQNLVKQDAFCFFHYGQHSQTEQSANNIIKKFYPDSTIEELKHIQTKLRRCNMGQDVSFKAINDCNSKIKNSLDVGANEKNHCNKITMKGNVDTSIDRLSIVQGSDVEVVEQSKEIEEETRNKDDQECCGGGGTTPRERGCCWVKVERRLCKSFIAAFQGVPWDASDSLIGCCCLLTLPRDSYATLKQLRVFNDSSGGILDWSSGEGVLGGGGWRGNVGTSETEATWLLKHKLLAPERCRCLHNLHPHLRAAASAEHSGVRIKRQPVIVSEQRANVRVAFGRQHNTHAEVPPPPARRPRWTRNKPRSQQQWEQQKQDQHLQQQLEEEPQHQRPQQGKKHCKNGSSSKKRKRASAALRAQLNAEAEECFSDGSEDGAGVEEWERAEAFKDSIEQKRCARERLYEEEIEQVWEKGGSGLNFHTDEAYWRALEGGFDERTCDDWDVDVQGFYGGVPGDYDAECRADMHRMDRLRAGGHESCFVEPAPPALPGPRRRHNKLFVAPLRESTATAQRRMLVELRRDDEAVPTTKTARRKANRAKRAPAALGEFEQHTRGIGRRVLEAAGWREGGGLGRDGDGIPRPVDLRGKRPHDKTGFGFEELHPPWLRPIDGSGSGAKLTSGGQQRSVLCSAAVAQNDLLDDGGGDDGGGAAPHELSLANLCRQSAAMRELLRANTALTLHQQQHEQKQQQQEQQPQETQHEDQKKQQEQQQHEDQQQQEQQQQEKL